MKEAECQKIIIIWLIYQGIFVSEIVLEKNFWDGAHTI